MKTSKESPSTASPQHQDVPSAHANPSAEKYTRQRQEKAKAQVKKDTGGQEPSKDQWAGWTSVKYIIL